MLKNVTGSRKALHTVPGTVGLCVFDRLLFILMACLLTPVTLQAAAADNPVTMHAQPRLCVVPAGEQNCSMQLQVSWTSTSIRNVCLQLHGQSGTLQCWQAQQAGTFSMTVAQTDNMRLQLMDAQSAEVLSEVVIPVVKRDVRDTRRRRRHAWSIF